MKHYLQPRRNDYDLFDAFDDFFKPMFFDESKDLRTDIKETETSYELDMELPERDKSITRKRISYGKRRKAKKGRKRQKILAQGNFRKHFEKLLCRHGYHA